MFKENTIKLGIAPIAWTNDDMPELGAENTFEQCISEMALAGFNGSEVGNKYPRNTAVLKKSLELRNLEIASAWFSAFLTTSRLKRRYKHLLSIEISCMIWVQKSSLFQSKDIVFKV